MYCDEVLIDWWQWCRNDESNRINAVVIQSPEDSEGGEHLSPFLKRSIYILNIHVWIYFNAIESYRAGRISTERFYGGPVSRNHIGPDLIFIGPDFRTDDGRTQHPGYFLKDGTCATSSTFCFYVFLDHFFVILAVKKLYMQCIYVLFSDSTKIVCYRISY